jgi:tripartite-type tricarboxylate transporter receptor subunit TctC
MKSLLAALALVGAAGTALAQGYPARPVTFIVPFVPGGGTDITARIVSAKLTQIWTQGGADAGGKFPVLVENRAGAAGLIGADVVAKAAPDGHTLLIANVGTQSINPYLYAKLPYDPDKAFAPVALICELPFVMMASNAFPPKSVREVIAYAKANPGKVTYGSSGSGGSPHLTAELFQALTGTTMLHVPYKGGAAAMPDLMSGNINLMFVSVLESSSHIKAGKVKGLAVTHARRNLALPDVPTIAEAGVPGGESGSWIALLAPAGTPTAIINRLNAGIRAVVADAEVREKLTAQGAVPQTGSPADLQALIDADAKRYSKIIRDQKLRVE